MAKNPLPESQNALKFLKKRDTQGATDFGSGTTNDFNKPDNKDKERVDYPDGGETDGDKRVEQLRREKKNQEKRIGQDKEHLKQDEEHLKQDEEHLKQDEEHFKQDEEHLKEINDELKEAQSKCGKHGK